MVGRLKNQERIRNRVPRKLFNFVSFLIALLLLAIWFFITWNRQQKIADERMEQLREDIVLTQEEELTEEERELLFHHYTDREKMEEFKDARKKVFLERMTLSSDLNVEYVILTKHEEENPHEMYFQVGLLCEFDDDVSEDLSVAYRYYEDGTTEKVFVYKYATVKSRLFCEKDTGMTAYYNTSSRQADVRDFSYYEWSMRNIFHRTDEEY